MALPLVALVLAASLLVPLAPFLPILHQLPLIGSPKLEIVFRLNGRRDLRLTTPPGQAHACLLEVEISNPSRWFSVKDTWVRLLMPSGIKIGRCDQFGRTEEGGDWEEFHAHRLGTHSRADYWHATDLEFPPRLTTRFRFKLQLGIGEQEDSLSYPIMLKLTAPSLYTSVERSATITVKRGEPDLAERMGPVITTAERAMERLAPPLLIGEPHEKEYRQLAMTVAVEASQVLIPAIGDNPLPQTPADVEATTHFAHVEMHVKALYVARNEIGRSAN